MRIETDKQQVYKNVMQLTAIAGRNRGNITAIAVTEDNLPALGIFLAEAVTDAENELRRHIAKSSQFSLYATETSIVIETRDLLREADSTSGQIASSLMLYLTHYAVSRWVSDIEAAKDLAEPYSNSAGGYLDKLKYLVCQRDEYTVEADSYEDRGEDIAPVTPSSILTEREYRPRWNECQTNDFCAKTEAEERIKDEEDVTPNPILTERGYEVRQEEDNNKRRPFETYSYEARQEEDNNKEPTFETHSYESRNEDKVSVTPNAILTDRAYSTRQRDVQPTGRIWPDGVLVDNENNILVSKK